MKRIDQLLDNHRQEMDFLEPPEGHFNRFQQKLDKGRVISKQLILRIAAAVIVLALISVKLLPLRSDSTNSLSVELKETAWYYNSLSEDLLSKIQNDKFISNSDKQLIMKDIQDFDKEYEIILENLNQFPGDERLINAFIDYHRSRTAFLEEILSQINITNLNII